MSLRNLKALLHPKSVAVIGASIKANEPGTIVMRNLLQSDFAGPIMPVTADYASVAGVLAYADVANLPMAPDLAVICSPASAIPGVIRALGEKGTRAAIIVTAALHNVLLADGETALALARAEAKRYEMRILGPNSLGLLVPAIGLNASIAPASARKGKIAFVSQSGALCSVVLDWATSKGIGFSHFIHTGDSVDVGLGDILDYLGSDGSTRAILLYLETIDAKRNFMSAARAAARNKPILVIKAGRSTEGALAAVTHTRAMAGSDLVFDAAIRRSGMLRVRDIEELFGGVETLARARPVKGPRLAILTNGGGIGVIAADDLADGGGKLAELPDELLEKLNAVLPPGWSHSNPVNIHSDSDGARYVKALTVLLESKEIDAVLVMYAPAAASDGTEVAQSIVKLFKEKTSANIMTCWVGEGKVAAARTLFAEAGVPSFETPRAAIEGFLHLLAYKRNQKMLMEVPPSVPEDFVPDTGFARDLVEAARAAGTEVLSEYESKAILAAYGIPTVETRTAGSPAEAARVAARMPGPWAVKILSPDIIHKSDVGGVVLDLHEPYEVEKAGNAILRRVAATFPDARIDGFTVQCMAERGAGTQELILGIATDPVFGPVILFGQGGVEVEVINDRAIALPPLNMALAAELVERTRIATLLRGFRGRPPANLEALYLTLIKVSQMIVDIPELMELDINPLLCDSQGVIAVDARIRLGEPKPKGQRMAIRPYPRDLEETFVMKDGREVLIRPIRPEDEPNHHVFISKLSIEDIRFRFFGTLHELPHSEMARMTQIDYDREMAFVAEAVTETGERETLGVVRTITDPDNEEAEFAIVIRSDLKASGLGKRLMVKMIAYCRSRGTRKMAGQVLQDNPRMLRFVEHLGFVPIRTVEGNVELELDLNKPDAFTT